MWLRITDEERGNMFILQGFPTSIPPVRQQFNWNQSTAQTNPGQQAVAGQQGNVGQGQPATLPARPADRIQVGARLNAQNEPQKKEPGFLSNLFGLGWKITGAKIANSFQGETRVLIGEFFGLGASQQRTRETPSDRTPQQRRDV
jgi:hypothetical protein